MNPNSAPSLDRLAILRKCRTKVLGKTLEILDECTSTNDVALKAAWSGAPHGYTLIAEHQTAGRGRLGRSWLSPRGGIWMTIILRPPSILNSLNALPLIGALGIAKAVSSSLSVNSRVRWPNDVLVGRRKFAGVLAETRSTGDRIAYALLGMGINTNFHPSLVQELDATSTSLLGLLGSPVDREALICSVLFEIEYLYELVCSNRDDEVLKSLREFDCSLGRRVRIKVGGGEIVGLLEDYETLTAVRIRLARGTHELIEAGSVIKVDYIDL